MRLLCNTNTPGVVILQGRIICTSEINVSQLINDVEKIALAQTRMEIQYTQLTALANCSVHLSELGQNAECVNIETKEFNASKTSNELGLKVGLPVGILLGLILSVSVLLGVCIFIYRDVRVENAPIGRDSVRGHNRGGGVIADRDGGPLISVEYNRRV